MQVMITIACPSLSTTTFFRALVAPQKTWTVTV